MYIATASWLAYDFHAQRHVPNIYTHYLVPLQIVLLILVFGKVRNWLQKDYTKNLPVLGRSLLILALCNYYVESDILLGPVAGKSAAYHRSEFEACEWAKKNLPPNAVIYSNFVSGALYYFTGFTVVRWDNIKTDAQQEEIERACASDGGRPIYAVLQDWELDGMETRYPDDDWDANWTQVEKLSFYTCWRLNPPQAALSSPAGPAQR